MRNSKAKIKKWWSGLDKYILFSVLTLIVIGLILVFSASQIIGNKYEVSEYFFIKKHSIFTILGLLTILSLSNLSTKNIIILSVIIFCLSTFLSISAILFFSELKGASRWIKVFNVSFQPSEFLKPSFIVLSSLFLSRYKSKQDNSIYINIFFLIFVSLILILQPDFGMFVLIFGVWFLQIMMARINLTIILTIILSFSLTAILSFIYIGHVQFRIKNFLFNIGDNYQISKSLEAFANGGYFGKGIGASEVSKKLPDVHSDFIVSLAAEELGLIFVIFIVMIYFLIFWRVFFISINENNFFNYSALSGLSNIFVFQSLINISSSLNLLPTKGMTLPFISYGGSSILASSIIIGFILSLTKKSR